jgi:hypothetical protein
MATTTQQHTCPHCNGTDLRGRGYQRPNVNGRSRTAIGINCGEDAIRQRVQCQTCRRYFALAPLERIEARPGRPKVSRSACDCGATDFRPAGWFEDGRQSVRCNQCGKEFALQPGRVVMGKETDSLGRKIEYSCEHEWELPSAADEAAALLRLFESGLFCDADEIRNLIRVTDSQARCMEFLEAQGMLASGSAARVIEFRSQVLLQFEKLVFKFQD